jgi:hypothetical protein
MRQQVPTTSQRQGLPNIHRLKVTVPEAITIGGERIHLRIGELDDANDVAKGKDHAQGNPGRRHGQCFLSYPTKLRKAAIAPPDPARYLTTFQ